MPKELYNLGRVTGLSSYEIYIKQHDSVAPNEDPATEREWLASMMGMGSSMILKIPKNVSHREDENWVYEVQFPTTTKLCAASTIIANFFRGSGRYSGSSVWADGVADYGDLISNTTSSSPSGTVGPTGTVPLKTLDDWTKEEKDKVEQYMKIIDGIVIQPGKWKDSSKKPPQKDLEPDLSSYPRIRLHMRGKIESEFEILLSGFMIKTVVVGQSGVDTSTDTQNPDDGDFLGPATFPWASKINFYVPSSYINYFMSQAYKRKLPTSAASKVVDDTAVIDMKTTQPETYYTTNHSDARVPVTVDDYTTLGDGTAVLTVYQKKDKYPPAIWGTFVDSKGTNYLNPLDVVAPGTVKMFPNGSAEDLKDYENTFPGTHGMSSTDDGKLEILDKDGNLVPAAEVTIRDISHPKIGGGSSAKMVQTQTGKDKALSLSLSDNLTGTQKTISADGSKTVSVGNTSANVGSQAKISPDTSNINFGMLLEALANDKSIDILGQNMKILKAGLPNNYIQFPNGLRLYISPTQPPTSGVPVGSIGIGWGIDDKK